MNNINHFKIQIDKNIKIEQVELTADINSTNTSNYHIYLISSNNTKIRMLRGGSICNNNYFIPTCNWMNGGFRLTTPAFLDENSKGIWQIEIINGNNNDTDTIKSIN